MLYIFLLSSKTTAINQSFYNKSVLKPIAIPSNITEIKLRCISLTQISIPSSVIKINDDAFYDCQNLTEISIPSSVMIIGKSAFSNCSKLKQIKIPSSVKYIGTNCFCNCISLKQFSIPPFVTSVEKDTFRYCKSLEKVFIPSSINFIDEYAFDGCESLKEVKIPPNITIIKHGTFSDCCSLKQVTIPPLVTTIECSAFSNCTSLSQVSIPPSVKFVEEYAFDNCPLFGEFQSNSYLEMTFIDATFGLFLFNLAFIIIIGLSVDFIIAIVWWSRIHPWFAHGYKSGKTVYRTLLTNWISILCIYVYIIFYLLIFLISEMCHNRIFFQRKRQFFKKLNLIFNISSIVILLLLVLVAVISSIVASSYGLKTQKEDGKSNKCLRYIFDGYQGASDWSLNQSVKIQNKLDKWHSKMLSKAYGKNGDPTNYYCFLVGIPLLLSTIAPFTLITIFGIIACIINC